jgi:glycine oxidase
MGAAAEPLTAAAAMAPGSPTLSVAGATPASPGHAGRASPRGGPRPPGLFYATGLYRSGILLAPATAAALADLIVDGRTALPLRGLGPRRMARAPVQLPST